MVSIMMLVMLALFLTGIPLIFAIGFSTLIYVSVDSPIPLTILPQQIISAVDKFVLLAIPLFLLTGRLMADGQLTARLMRFSQSLVGWLRGGLAQVNVLTNMLMAGISGSSLADAAATGGAIIPLMKRSGYSAPFSAVVTAAAACIGPIIPPSVIMVVIGGLTTVSIARMFLGGIVPGLLIGLLFALLIARISRRRDYPKDSGINLKEVVSSFIDALPTLGLPVIIIGGILSGAFTPTEAAAIAAIYTMILTALYREITLRMFYHAVVDIAVASGAILFVVCVSGILGWVLIVERIGSDVVALMSSISTDPTVILALMTLALLVLGFFIEILAVLILTVPVLMPLVQTVGIDPVHFGVVATIALATGLITPPFGLGMFLTSGIAQIRLEEFSREAVPFIACLILSLAILILVPELVVTLPNMVMGEVK